MLSCAGADRLQTGMRGAWGKPYGLVARVNIGQILLSIRCKDSNAAIAMEALRRARYKVRATLPAHSLTPQFPGRQKIIVSKKWGFSSFSRADFPAARAAGLVVPDGAGVKYHSNHVRHRVVDLR